MTNECIPFFEAAYTQKLTAHFTAAVLGKRFCGPLTTYQGTGPALSADPLPAGDGGNLVTAGPPAAGGQIGGVVGWDVASGGKGPVIRGAGTILPMSSGAGITSGAEVSTDNTGRVVTAATGNRVLGKAHSTVAGADLDVVIELYAIGGTVSP